MALESVEKQPAEVMSFDINFSEWLDNRGEDAASVTATAASGITLVSTYLIGKAARCRFSGGTTGQTYKVTVQLTTATGLVKEYDFNVKVKEL